MRGWEIRGNGCGGPFGLGGPGAGSGGPAENEQGIARGIALGLSDG